jgi:hypothetical protein
MNALNEWWDALEIAMKIFYGIAFFSTAIMSVQTLLTLFGADADHDLGGDHDASHGHHGASDVSVLSFRSIIAFLVGFGWMGAIMGDLGWSLLFVIPLALAAGVILMYFVYWFMKLLHGMRASGNLDYVYAIGEVGTVYLPVPPNKEKAGKVEVLLQGRLVVVDAFTSAEEKIPNREKVRIIDVVGTDALLVEPLNE